MTDSIKSTDYEVELRIDKVIALMVEGWSQKQIVQHLFDTEDWGITKRQLRTYCYRAQEALAKEVGKVDRRELLMRAHYRYEALYREAREAGDRRDAMAALDRWVALWGVNVADNLAVSWEKELLEAGGDPEQIRDNIISLLEAGQHAG